MYLIITKIIISVLVVLGIVFMSEKNPRTGGMLIGLPLTVAIMIFFYGLEQGIPFVINSIPYGISGLVCNLSFAIGFYIGGKFFTKTKILHLLSAMLGGLVVFLATSILLSFLDITLIESIFIFLFGAIFSIFFFHHIRDKKNTDRKKSTITTMIFRAIFAATLILIITGIAKIIGTRWAGIMASFPAVMLPSLLILAYSYSDKLYPSVLKHIPYSYTTLLIFYLLVLYLFPMFGIYLGMLITYIICILYLYIVHKLKLHFLETNQNF